MQVTSPTSAVDPKRPYGGLVPSQPKGTRAFHDAAAYNQHLAQQQVFAAQAQAASQATVYRNPYLQPNQQQQQQQPQQQQQQSQQQQGSVPVYNNTQDLGNANFQTSHGHLGAGGSTQYSGPGGFPVQSQHLQPAPPSTTYQAGPTTRARSNTINHMMDTVPPALARLQHMNQDVIGGRKALTPVLKRDDGIREWERRQSGKAAAAQPYPQLEYLQQQAEIAAAQGLANWAYNSHNQGQGSNRYPPPSSNLAHSYTSMVVDDDRREAVMSNVRSAARGEPAQHNAYTSSTSIIPSPPQAYTSNATTAGNRYQATYAQQTPTSPFDALDRRPDMGQLYVPMQPDQYGPYNNSGSSATQGSSSRPVAPPAQAVPPSFYGASVVPSGQPGGVQQRNPFSQTDGMQPTMSTKEARRKSQMDIWQQ